MVKVQDIQPGTLLRWDRTIVPRLTTPVTVMVIGIWAHESNVYWKRVRFFCAEEQRFWDTVSEVDEQYCYATMLLWCT